MLLVALTCLILCRRQTCAFLEYGLEIVACVETALLGYRLVAPVGVAFQQLFGRLNAMEGNPPAELLVAGGLQPVRQLVTRYADLLGHRLDGDTAAQMAALGEPVVGRFGDAVCRVFACRLFVSRASSSTSCCTSSSFSSASRICMAALVRM